MGFGRSHYVSSFFDQSGAAQESCDSLAYKTLMNTETLNSYMNMLRETHWLVVMGTKGTCKTSLATGLSRHLSLIVSGEEGEDVEDVIGGVGGEIVNFNLDKDELEVGVVMSNTIYNLLIRTGALDLKVVCNIVIQPKRSNSFLHKFDPTSF